jgi:hypothetical protein
MGERTPATAGRVLHRPRLRRFHKGDVFSVSVFPPRSNQAKGWRLCRAGAMRFARAISTDVVRPRPSKWRIRRSIIPSSVHEPKFGARHERTDCRKITSAPRPNAFRAYSTDGRQPFVPATSATLACSSLSFRFPFFEAGTVVRRRSSARRDPAMAENITRTKGACQENS